MQVGFYVEILSRFVSELLIHDNQESWTTNETYAGCRGN
jgi:hypothetical protein